MRTAALLKLLHGLDPCEGPEVTLAGLARRAGRSRFHFHRDFRTSLGETPRQFIERLRLEHAAARLVHSRAAVLEIALQSGFTSHEVFTRAFGRRFGCSPARYRRTALAQATDAERARHVALTGAIGPCIQLFHLSLQHPSRRSAMPVLSIAREERPAQPLLLIRRRIVRTELPAMLAECFGKLYAHGQRAGLPIAGFPLARYVTTGAGLWTVEAAMPLAASAPGEGEMEPGTLPAGPVALGIHTGSYDDLPATHAAIERWIDERGLRAAGAPWEWYVTDPAQHPNPADWRTEVYWPLAT
jgi:AraC-like DNA-binding protein/effector-binding domain-containing protein